MRQWLLVIAGRWGLENLDWRARSDARNATHRLVLCSLPPPRGKHGQARRHATHRLVLRSLPPPTRSLPLLTKL